MDFSFSAEQEHIRETARRYARDKLAPVYQQRERDGDMPPALFREMGELGFIGPALPEAYGGAGLDHVSVGIITEEIAYADMNVAYIPMLHGLCASIVAQHAAPELARDVLPRLCAGEVVMALALTEPQSGSDAAHARVKAVRDGNRWLLSGEKTSISFADKAHYAITFARTDPEVEGARGMSAFLVPLDAPGVTRTPFNDLGSKIVGRGSLFFEDTPVPAEMMLGGEGKGFTQVMQGFDFSRALIGLQCLAPARASLDETWRYVTERQAFGKPIAKYEGVSFPLAEGETQVSAARLLCYQTLWARDEGRPHTAEAAMVKWWAPKLAFDVIHRCLLAHGHGGYSDDFPHQQRLRDVLGLQIGDGTAEIMKLIIAREKVGRVAVPY